MRETLATPDERAWTVITAPNVPESVRRLIEDAHASWYEPDGEARLHLGPLFLSRERARRKRPLGDGPTRYIANPFAGGSGRDRLGAARRSHTRMEDRRLAKQTGTSPGLVSRLLSTLERDGFLERGHGATSVRNAAALREALAEADSHDDNGRSERLTGRTPRQRLPHARQPRFICRQALPEPELGGDAEQPLAQRREIAPHKPRIHIPRQPTPHPRRQRRIPTVSVAHTHTPPGRSDLHNALGHPALGTHSSQRRQGTSHNCENSCRRAP